MVTASSLPQHPSSDSDRQRHLLVFEPDARGHSEEWLGHLLRHLPGHGPVGALSLAVAPELARRLEPAIAACQVPALCVIPLDERTLARCTSGRLAVSGFARWWAMRRCVEETGADIALFLALDHLSLPLGLQLGARACRLSGILFRPSVHYGTIGPYDPTLAERIRDLRKEILYRLMLRNPSLVSVLSLDPFFAAYAAERYHGGGKVRSLADPFHAPDGDDCKATVVPSAGRKAFLLFGELTERKGLLVLMEALARLEPDVTSRIAVTIAGRIDPNLRSRANELAAAAIRVHPQLVLRIEDRRLSSAEIASLVRGCDTVLAPYQRFVGSSGVLIWAAAYGKPVLTQDFGLMGRLVRAHRLGHTVDTLDPDALAHSLAVIVKGHGMAATDPSGTAEFLADKTPEAFVATLVRGAVEKSLKTAIHA